MRKPAEQLTINDIERFPIWSFINDDDLGETLVESVEEIPVGDLSGKLVGTKVKFANGTEHWAIMGNINVESYQQTKHLLTISIFVNNMIFHLARYHDHEFAVAGPNVFAKFANMPIDEIFPIMYDLSKYSTGDLRVLIGRIEAEPTEKLSREEIIAMVIS